MDLFASPPAEDALDLADRLWHWMLTSGVRIVVILLVAALLSAAASWLLRRFFRTMIEGSSKLTSTAGFVVKRDRRALMAAQSRRAQRAETLSNVARNVASMSIWAMALVMVLSEIGVNIAPVIASLGVLGLAAGIGAQTIIKDVVAGVVMLFEDIVAVGDVVDLEYATGTVEEINLRVTQVRSVDGVLWTVRNGEIIRIGNMSRGFANAVVLLDLDPASDNTQVTEVLEQVAAEFTTDPDWVDVVQGDATISGILGVNGSRVQRRVLVQVAPGEQWGAEQELRRRITAAFREAGVSFALPRFSDVAQKG
ncbi:mechanosensitive ion channel family protein [Brachybacterium sp. p3-SID1565]|uniref:mechanosensitive ion channel family protein n=1 Tax=Brachybacterium sp. p3-SID1565 TaxID=2916046 RepID=UPI0021A772AD|nr:mechanosensitive ion channel family protein [Brachybacterium sp. p3-SID1565]MCT1385994.1 mechanosensitive ion channel family protein [Brachybacterium sp. p3-SID1565]